MGDSEFVMTIVSRADERMDRRYGQKSRGYCLYKLLRGVGTLSDLTKEVVLEEQTKGASGSTDCLVIAPRGV